jgi:hypothetical protein
MKTTYPNHPMRDYNEWIAAVHNYFRMTAAEYVRNKYIRRFTPFRIDSDGKGYYLIGDDKIPAKQFEQKFPLPLFVNKNDENPNNLGSMLSETI